MQNLVKTKESMGKTILVNRINGFQSGTMKLVRVVTFSIKFQ